MQVRIRRFLLTILTTKFILEKNVTLMFPALLQEKNKKKNRYFQFKKFTSPPLDPKEKQTYLTED